MRKIKGKKAATGYTVAEPTCETSISLYAAQPQRSDSSNRQKVTITINKSLLDTIDDFVDRAGTNRSAVFEQALLMWCQRLQEQADVEYYGNLTQADVAANDSWTEIATEAAKQIWKK